MKYKYSRKEIAERLKIKYKENSYITEMLLALADKPTVSELCHNCNKDLTDTDKPKEECKHHYYIWHNGKKEHTKNCIKCGFYPLKTKPEIEKIPIKKRVCPLECRELFEYCTTLDKKIDEIIDFLSTKDKKEEK